MMRVVVSYTKVVEEIIEIDDEFNKLTDSGGYEDLDYEEREALESALMETAVNNTGAYWHDVFRIENAENNELMLEI